MKNSQKGFILPLILVFATILVVTGGAYYYHVKSTAVLNTVLNQKEGVSSRDMRRNVDINNIKTGLQLYFQSNGAYPANLNALVAARILASIPTDPQTNSEYKYELASNTDFKLCTRFEGVPTEKCIGSDESQTTAPNTPTKPTSPIKTTAKPPEKITGQPFVDNMPNGLPAGFSAAGTNNLKVSIVKSIQAQLYAYVNNDNPAQFQANNTDYVKYPQKLSSVFGGGATPTDPVTKKTIEYTVATDGKDYTLCIEFQTGAKTCGHSDMNWSVYLIKQ